jgi:hypothetical protein
MATTRKPRPKPNTTDKKPPLTAPTDIGGLDGLLALALKQDAPVEALERLIALKERLDGKAAAEAFFAAKADFQRVCPRIHKSSKVDFASSTGGRVQYAFAALDSIADTINPLLHERGLSYAWDTSIEGATATVRCTLRHTGGHSETSQFLSPTTSKTPGMSDQQRYGAAVKYAMRWSLIQVLGLVTTDDDNDAAEVDPTPVSADQLVQIEELLEAKRETVRTPEKLLPKFLKFMGVEKLAEIRATDYDKAVQALTPKADEKSDDGKGDA